MTALTDVSSLAAAFIVCCQNGSMMVHAWDWRPFFTALCSVFMFVLTKKQTDTMEESRA